MLPQVCVCYIIRSTPAGEEVLLGRKKGGLGVGKYVGPGGKLEAGESARDAIVREVAEEVGIRVSDDALEQRGRLTYLFPHREAWSQQSTVFVAREFTGEPTSSDELDPEWFALDAVPLSLMWDDARFWLPGVLAGGRVERGFTFGADLETVSEVHPFSIRISS